jgi:cell division protein FtsI/penicillin-binding protein 2
MSGFHPLPPSDRALRARGRVALAVFAVLLAVIAARFVQLQVFQHHIWLERARITQQRTLEMPPERGTILDRNGLVLAVDVRAMAIAVDGIHIRHPDIIVQILHEELSLSRAEVEAKVLRDSYFTWIDRRVDFDVAQRIQARAREAGTHGLIFLDTWKRLYPQGKLASNLIGFVGTDGVGLEGIELVYEQHLRGTPRVIRVMEGGDGRAYDTAVIQEGTRGQDLVLSLDAKIQFICEEEIRTGVTKLRALAGVIVIIDPHTGDVLAMAQDKGYDLNRFWTSTPEQRKNWAVSHLFEPGSVFKVITALAALESGDVRPTDIFDGDTGISVSGHTMHNAGFLSYGPVDMRRIIEMSINTGVIRIAQILGKERFHEFLVSLGFGQLSGVALPGEEPGLLRPHAEWSTLDLAAASIGQSIAVTAVQLARAIAVVASGGSLPTPRVVLPAVPAQETDPPPRVCSASTTEIMLDFMRTVVVSGTGIYAEVEGYPMAGKSGTAQKALPGRGYVEGKYTSLFAGVITARAPEYVMLVVLDEVQVGDPGGGTACAPIFRQAATRLVSYERMKPF